MDQPTLQSQKLDAADAELETVRAKFSRQLQRLGNRRAAIEAAESEIMAEQDVLRSDREALQHAQEELVDTGKNVEHRIAEIVDALEVHP